MGLSWILTLSFTIIATVSAKDCKKTVLTKTEGEFQSPGYPSPYPKKVECEYVIKAPKNHYVEIIFDVFEVQDMYTYSQLLADYLEVFDGRESNRKQEATYYGKLEPFKFVSQTNRVIMRFVSDAWKTFKGFHASYKIIPVPTKSQCETLVIHKGIVSCTLDKSGEKPVSCNVTCEQNYELLHDMGYIDCTASSPELPQCKANRVKLDICVADVTHPECPYTAEETGFEMKVVLEDIGDMSSMLMRSPSSCRMALCLMTTDPKRFLYACLRYASYMQQAHKWNEQTTNLWRERCFYCQRNNCGRSAPYFASG